MNPSKSVTASKMLNNYEVNYATMIRSFENKGDFEVLKTLQGTRGQVSAEGLKNETVSISLDLATVLCITCEHKHSILLTVLATRTTLSLSSAGILSGHT
jgi:hypothetical protein